LHKSLFDKIIQIIIRLFIHPHGHINHSCGPFGARLLQIEIKNCILQMENQFLLRSQFKILSLFFLKFFFSESDNGSEKRNPKLKGG
jgi:hypothetical protein